MHPDEPFRQSGACTDEAPEQVLQRPSRSWWKVAQGRLYWPAGSVAEDGNAHGSSPHAAMARLAAKLISNAEDVAVGDGARVLPALGALGTRSPIHVRSSHR